MGAEFGGLVPTIAIISIAGEVEPVTHRQRSPRPPRNSPISIPGRCVRSTQLTGTTSCPGGLLQLDWNSGIDWRAILMHSASIACTGSTRTASRLLAAIVPLPVR